MRRESEWGDHVAIVAISQLYDAAVQVISVDPRFDCSLVPLGTAGPRCKLILGHYPELHFVSFQKKTRLLS